ncbi:uncharacterized protein LOC26514811 isoform X5 [Drosophila ananassae]|uniref:uncharacterized protein LOC26514811 isoform X5 n=1 Tax=Drosophila ananassae TaxID=7217 RepID=UPI001CFFF48B|nr:uncharacterized protein LOC26514811 isoform X5 [Drosophila ananassae]
MRRQSLSVFRQLIRQCQLLSTPIPVRPKIGTPTPGGAHIVKETWAFSYCCSFACRSYSKFNTHLSTERAMELLCNLDEEERCNLRDALGKIDDEKKKKLFKNLANQIEATNFCNCQPRTPTPQDRTPYQEQLNRLPA